MMREVINTVLNLTAFHHAEHEDAPPVVVEKLESGDWCLTRTNADGTVTYIEIIDKDTGEFTSTCRDLTITNTHDNDNDPTTATR